VHVGKFNVNWTKNKPGKLKGTRWLWSTNPENLTQEQRQKNGNAERAFPRLKQLVEQRDSLRDIFEDQSIQDAATGPPTDLRTWIEAGQDDQG